MGNSPSNAVPSGLGTTLTPSEVKQVKKYREALLNQDYLAKKHQQQQKEQDVREYADHQKQKANNEATEAFGKLMGAVYAPGENPLHKKWAAAHEREEAAERDTEDLKADRVPENELIKASDLYSSACQYYHGGEKLKAAETFWSALVCGDNRAAYDLCQMFAKGDGITANSELYGIILWVSLCIQGRNTDLQKDIRAPKWLDDSIIDSSQQDLSGVLYGVCADVQNNFIQKNHGITECILTQNILNWRFDVVNDKLSTDATDRSCLKYHTIPELMILPFEEHYPPQQTLSGDNDNSCCSIM